MHGNVILIGDQAKTSYITKEQISREVKDNLISITWNAVHQKERKSKFSLVVDFNRGKNTYMFFHGDVV